MAEAITFVLAAGAAFALGWVQKNHLRLWTNKAIPVVNLVVVVGLASMLSGRDLSITLSALIGGLFAWALHQVYKMTVQLPPGPPS